ncbi:hypothetical protein D9619_002219 [Psilocybe cf. subviscida]|uniref:DUF6697 domain-containing protein n=1 Tax=Psilocybe cf. subviscida TaxID=2480587 RepID=A0A8H5F3T4_9AGAR|nr:hypothetical protein D9619_002219 [Psilocybe cf. subviscida]
MRLSPRGPNKMQESTQPHTHTTQASVPFGVTYEKIGTIQRRLAWPLHKDDTLSRSGRSTDLNIYFVLTVREVQPPCPHVTYSVASLPPIMTSTDPSAPVDELAKLQAQVLSFERRNAALGTELESTKSELRDTRALLGQVVVQASRQPQGASTSTFPTRLTASSSRLKRPRSPTLEQTDLPPPPSKKDKGRARGNENIAEAGPSHSGSSSASLARAPSFAKVKESPGKAVKLEFAPTTEVINIDDDSDQNSDTEHAVGLVPQRPAANDGDSDFEDPNVSREEWLEDVSIQASEGEDTPPAAKPQRSSAEPARDPRQASEPLRRSARFSSTSSLTTVSASVTPAQTTPDAEDKANIDRKPKREPKREPKQEDVFRLPSSVTSLYLHSAKPFVITPPPMTLEIPRAFLRLAYGGSDQQFVQSIPAARNPGPSFTVNSEGVKVPKDKRRLVFPMLHLNPSMPSSPGAPGLVFASRHEILHNPPWTLFCKRKNEKPAVWLYLGEYESELVGKLTPEQFMAQSEVVQDHWAELITTQQVQVCYMSMRARIVLRAAGSIPIDNKEREEALVNEEVEKIRRGKGKKVTTRQILEAFSNGDEGVDIIRMKCVKYDHVFAHDIAKRFKDYPKMVADAKAKKQKQKRKPTRSASRRTSTSSRTRHQKPSNVDLADEEEEEDDNNSDGDDERVPEKRKGKTVARSTQTSKSKSKSGKITSTRSRSTGTPSPSASGSARPRRRTAAAAVVTAVDDSEDEIDDRHGADSDDYENEDAVEDEQLE